MRDQLDPEATRSGRRTLDARRGDLRPLFTVSVNTGSDGASSAGLEWRDVDFLTGLITVRQTKSGLRSPDSDEQPCPVGDGGPGQPAVIS